MGEGSSTGTAVSVSASVPLPGAASEASAATVAPGAGTTDPAEVSACVSRETLSGGSASREASSGAACGSVSRETSSGGSDPRESSPHAPSCSVSRETVPAMCCGAVCPPAAPSWVSASGPSSGDVSMTLSDTVSRETVSGPGQPSGLVADPASRGQPSPGAVVCTSARSLVALTRTTFMVRDFGARSSNPTTVGHAKASSTSDSKRVAAAATRRGVTGVATPSRHPGDRPSPAANLTLHPTPGRRRPDPLHRVLRRSRCCDHDTYCAVARGVERSLGSSRGRRSGGRPAPERHPAGRLMGHVHDVVEDAPMSGADASVHPCAGASAPVDGLGMTGGFRVWTTPKSRTRTPVSPCGKRPSRSARNTPQGLSRQADAGARRPRKPG